MPLRDVVLERIQNNLRDDTDTEPNKIKVGFDLPGTGRRA
jgi:hypothetical protein